MCIKETTGIKAETSGTVFALFLRKLLKSTVSQALNSTMTMNVLFMESSILLKTLEELLKAKLLNGNRSIRALVKKTSSSS